MNTNAQHWLFMGVVLLKRETDGSEKRNFVIYSEHAAIGTFQWINKIVRIFVEAKPIFIHMLCEASRAYAFEQMLCLGVQHSELLANKLAYPSVIWAIYREGKSKFNNREYRRIQILWNNQGSLKSEVFERNLFIKNITCSLPWIWQRSQNIHHKICTIRSVRRWNVVQKRAVQN